MNIYVGNLAYEVTEDDLRQEFAAFGEVTSVAIMKDSYSGQSRGFGFVEMPKLTEGQAAINGLNGKKLKERALTVNGARPRSSGGDNRSFGGGGGRKGKQPYGKRGGGGGFGGGRGGMRRY
ncbi:MAG: RNA-binding protein [Dehalococcoidia bacterium]|nr:RNA-binding protein [Dehalococcoidia bacterium]MDD5495363.1 RNA-binding protein [Dehalococcoidia bacterium]